jgi:hypothetical protein
MKLSQISGMIIGVGAVALGAIAYMTNPSQGEYETYAGQQLAIYLKENVCRDPGADLPFGLGNVQKDLLKDYCETFVETSKTQLGELIGRQTSADNYLFFSIYQTDIALPAPLPHYSFGTIGLFQRFYTYRAEQT